ncbi:hypothetical protein PHSC3_000686 [Chlamydiales bacterium STE3]|nr:hypothetical protein PHSC3_000686 [Chlamydiales bacterium STE3]
MSAPITSQKFSDTYKEAEKLINFLSNFRTNKNAKYSTKLNTVHNLFGDTWDNRKVKSGHMKLEHSITRVVIEYSAHENPVDPGAVTTIAEQIQTHLNIFFNQFLDCSPRSRNSISLPNFEKIARKAR